MAELTVEERWTIALSTAEAFPRFQDFATVAAAKWIPGFLHLSKVQMQMCEYLNDGPRLRMLQAQRGEGKTYITAFYVVWRWIHNPSLAVLVVSAGKDTADDIVFLITQMVQEWDILEYMRPSSSDGDRTSMYKFDIHRALKGLNKQPSITSVPVLGTLPGKRPDMVLADDIESNKNSLTATARETLISRSKEFTRMCTHGDVIYLGTPQSKDSVYNTLPARGFEIRIWPGRYPVKNEEGGDQYGNKLCPVLRAEMELDPSLRKGGGIQGNLGKPTDPERYDEEALQEKELDNGPEDFALQYLLDTSLSDEVRLQLKLRDLMVVDCAADYIPREFAWLADTSAAVALPPEFPVTGASLYRGQALMGSGFDRPDVVWCAIDPAGEGGDEMAMAVGTAVGNTVHILDLWASRGGLSEKNTDSILGFLRKNNVTHIHCESNMGAGLFELGIRNLLAGSDLKHLVDSVSGTYSKGQKERRIINTLRPLMQRHRIAVHEQVLRSDRACSSAYGVGTRHQYSLFYQLANITTDRDSLPADDRIDAVSMLVQILGNTVMTDPMEAAAERERQDYLEWIQNPLGEYGWTKVTEQPRQHTVWD